MTRETAPDIRLDTVTAPELAPFEALYLAAFPESERKPFALLQTRAVEGKAELLSIRCRDRFAGLVITLLDGKYALVDYLAVSPDFRNHGIGAVVLDLIRSRYPDRLVFLEIEEPKTEMQERRRRFYMRNGILPTGLAVELFGEEMLILSDGGAPVPFEEYEALLYHTAGAYTRGKVKCRGFTPPQA